MMDRIMIPVDVGVLEQFAYRSEKDIVLYSLTVVGLFLVYIGAFYGVVRLVRGKKPVAV